ncbi:histidine kinase [Alkalihalobacillus alcalophilus ATCC 27647 = CGMCC 1.3604]|uniref:histidine kinase n=1 Tax=Alkalihalobacillus alcalophilus ATCC 27647 = CGMCC 1.3604 TaxID=1218173 RepID=A0A094WLE4_ALKAL|nr:histidine kinase [Alkalihalobacillus alcalophilus]KGA96728.1 histidine kinase [Alkalihalobacillus alcalophilus ATCC 27647 = CGMCC 1.3604]MED1561754.1 histidine kinase [Alkalihalobacillus alcalophilus]THG91904.1 histidine kinase [Alkalihalobacillus alcalophilus ATCC 27647 = CGMCC 1.3604]
MNKIQKKILMITSVVLIIMVVFWIALTLFSHKTQNQYNEILQRYLSMNEVSRASQQVLTDLNNYMILSSVENLEKLEESKEQVESAKYEIFKLRNTENNFSITNYIHLIESFIETTDRLLLFQEEKDTEASAKEFSEANRISNYISEMTLSLIDTELNTYDRFYRGIIQQSEEFIKLGIWSLLLITFILLLVTYWFSLSIIRPVQKLTKAANELSKGNFDLQIKVDTNDEMAFLARTFDRMRININNLILEIKHKAGLERELQQNKILLQESQFRTLQSQISPHFLFNTLNTISKKAYLEGSEETSDLLVSVAGLLRYNLKQIDRAVTVEEEVAVINQYMHIQKARFTERLQFSFEIDKEALHVRIPPLTLQPIVENAVIHAIEPKEDGGHISFRVQDNIDQVMIEIEDDGQGMTAEKIKQILDEQMSPSEGHSTGIGFSNVVKRLRLFYGYEDVIDIESELGRGTKVVIKIRKQGGEIDAKAPNRG